MLKVGLTGSIGMGKSTIASMFTKLGIGVWSADDAVHILYKKGGKANILIQKEFGKIADENGDIDRKKLSAIVIKDINALKKLENIVHPLVKQNREQFIETSMKNNAPYVILDIPLLFETNSQNEFDKIIVVDCDFETQKQRVLSRPNMNLEKFNAIIAKQMPNAKKTDAADFIIDTSQSLEKCRNRVIEIDIELKKLSKDA
ncbi:MAG: dephospho-CoA kinase [Caulobacterales bacterium]|nr:dephospho-CoA kinase [Caulobacterales bacterium]MCA0371889.1 dephospho-CoA kinase [Pseudomonadota bacterium]